MSPESEIPYGYSLCSEGPRVYVKLHDKVLYLKDSDGRTVGVDEYTERVSGAGEIVGVRSLSDQEYFSDGEMDAELSPEELLFEMAGCIEKAVSGDTADTLSSAYGNKRAKECRLVKQRKRFTVIPKGEGNVSWGGKVKSASKNDIASMLGKLFNGKKANQNTLGKGMFDKLGDILGQGLF